MAFRDNFNNTFWKYLMGFMLVLVVSLFAIIITGTFAGEVSTTPEEEECMFFC
jgi:hypothetical protein